jgi:hypothetical protein
MGLLSGVYQEKEEREGARGHRALLDAQTIDCAQELLERRRILFAVAPRPSRDANLLDDLE